MSIANGSTATRQTVPATKFFMTKIEAANALGVCTRTIENLISSGSLKAIRIGKAVRIPITDIENFGHKTHHVTQPKPESVQ